MYVHFLAGTGHWSSASYQVDLHFVWKPLFIIIWFRPLADFIILVLPKYNVNALVGCCLLALEAFPKVKEFKNILPCEMFR